MVLEKAETGLASRWGWVVARGVMGVLFGLIAFSRPGAMAFSMVLLFGCFAFAAGIATVIAAARSGPRRRKLGRAAARWLAEHRRRRDRPALARVDGAGVRLDHRRLGDRDRRAGDRERDQAAQIIEHEWLLAIAGACRSRSARSCSTARSRAVSRSSGGWAPTRCCSA